MMAPEGKLLRKRLTGIAGALWVLTLATRPAKDFSFTISNRRISRLYAHHAFQRQLAGDRVV